MKNINFVLIIVLFIFLCVFIYMQTRKIINSKGFVNVKSSIDGRTYKVLDFPDSQKAANILAAINEKNIKLIEYMDKKYNSTTNSSILTDRYNVGKLLVSRLKKNYRTDRLEENHPVDTKNTSYTEDKGKKIAYCLREKLSGENKLQDMNIIEFVNLHEIAHIASSEYGHKDEFWSNFDFILEDANESGLHHVQDYSKDPQNYCGLVVAYNPYFDSTL